MRQNRQILFIILLIVTFYLAFFSEETFVIRTLAFAIYFLIVMSVSYGLMLENRSPYKTLLWIYAILFLPIIGYLFFIYSGQLQVRGHLFQKKREDNYKYLKQNTKNIPSDCWHQLGNHEQFISHVIEKETHFPASCFSETSVLKDGQETFPAIKESLMQAKEYIHMEYYTFRDDEIGQDIINLLIEKSEQGLEVKVIYDAVGSMKMSGKMIRKMETAGVQMACFLPIKHGFFNQKINFRNHRKIIVVDGVTGFVGGLNIGDEYLSRDPSIGFWRDTHLMVKGEAVGSLHAVFFTDWSYLTNQSLDPDQYPVTKSPSSDDGCVQVVASGPNANQGIMSELYFNMIASAEHSLWIATPYFVPNKDIRTALSLAVKKGVDVKLMVPEVGDGFLTQYATRSYFDELLDKGIEVHLYHKGFMHQKIMIVDGEFASIGTANVDFRSLNLNFEVNVFLFHSPSVTSLIENYKADIKHSRKVDPKTYYKRGLLIQSKESFARLFSPVL
ncbi:cardiolipin synthase [Virgibacillus phasianinus]|uniref:Cardiolipin synthase n=1 Tax=Virgibacillus phasianinus TaxID=2017483 RepID=A0A220U2J9_9BACI|nr:cardiolipin synthase [Virgibacillus phasianinus]ASK62265.1 cardiolipin synthase [Virgibacillus phasianinus]